MVLEVATWVAAGALHLLLQLHKPGVGQGVGDDVAQGVAEEVCVAQGVVELKLNSKGNCSTTERMYMVPLPASCKMLVADSGMAGAEGCRRS